MAFQCVHVTSMLSLHPLTRPIFGKVMLDVTVLTY